jgi:alpha-L-fucosidase
MKLNLKTCSLIATCAALSIKSVCAVELIPETEDAYNERMQWFTDAEFGLFIHYGVYSTLGGEWKGKSVPKYAEWIQRWAKITPEEYIPLAADFKPEKLDADLWVKTAIEAGMKYMVITSKHHEGFCLWDSAYTEYDLGEATTFDRDILGELKAACDQYGLKFGLYYSLTDWHHPSQRVSIVGGMQTPMNDKEGYVTYMKGQLKELIDRYDPAILWFDGDWANWWSLEDGKDLYNYLRELSPELIVNNRVAKRNRFKKDFGTPENQTPKTALDHVWEACWTVNHSWGYKKSDTRWKRIDELVQKQIDINTKGGNLLLNVGPYADGSWPQGSTDLLLQMGAWNKAHSDAVYGAEYIKMKSPAWGAIAQSKASSPAVGELFAYVFNWPKDGKLTLPDFSADEVKVTTYEGVTLPSTLSGAGLAIDLSPAKPTPHTTVLRIAYRGLQKSKSGKVVSLKLSGNELYLDAPDAKLSGKVNVLQSHTYIGYWTDPSDTATWTVDVPAPGKYAVKFLYSCPKAYAGSDVKLTISGQSMTAKVPASKGRWEDFELLDLGLIELNQVGTTECTIGFGQKKGKALFNLKAVVFIPIDE